MELKPALVPTGVATRELFYLTAGLTVMHEAIPQPSQPVIEPAPGGQDVPMRKDVKLKRSVVGFVERSVMPRSSSVVSQKQGR